jgi:two-component sensor histidine kinase
MRTFYILLFCITLSFLGFSKTELSISFRKIQYKISKSDIPDSVITYAYQALEIGISHKNSLEKGYALLYLSRGNILKSEYEQTKNFLNKALFWARNAKNKNLEGLVLLEQGKNYQLISTPDKALFLMLKAKRIFDRNKYKESLIRANVYLAEYYRSLQKFLDGEQHIRQALLESKRTKIEDKLRINLYNRAAALKTETRDHDSAFYYSKLATDLAQKIGMFNEKAISLNEVGFVYENINKYDKALENYEEAKKLWFESKELRNWVLVTENIARTYRKMGQYAKSNEIAFEAAKIAKGRNWNANLLSIYILIGGNYVMMDNFSKAHEYGYQGMALELILYKEKNLKEIKEIKAKYETEKKEELLKEKNKEIRNSQDKINYQRKSERKLYVSIVVLIVSLIILAYLAINRALILSQLKTKSKELETSNLNLNSSLKKSEVLLQEVHHRVKNNLQFITSIIELEIESNSISSKKDILTDISRRISAMSLVHELLYNEENVESIVAKKYIEDLVVSIDEMINRQKIPIQFELEIDNMLFEVKQCIAIGMIISELVSNSIKHAFLNQKQPIISIQLLKKKESNLISLKVKDNGSGYSKETVSNKGLGSRLVHIFTVQLEGTYSINSKNQFLFQFEFPYKS